MTCIDNGDTVLRLPERPPEFPNTQVGPVCLRLPCGGHLRRRVGLRHDPGVFPFGFFDWCMLLHALPQVFIGCPQLTQRVICLCRFSRSTRRRLESLLRFFVTVLGALAASAVRERLPEFPGPLYKILLLAARLGSVICCSLSAGPQRGKMEKRSRCCCCVGVPYNALLPGFERCACEAVDRGFVPRAAERAGANAVRRRERDGLSSNQPTQWDLPHFTTVRATATSAEQGRCYFSLCCVGWSFKLHNIISVRIVVS